MLPTPMLNGQQVGLCIVLYEHARRKHELSLIQLQQAPC